MMPRKAWGFVLRGLLMMSAPVLLVVFGASIHAATHTEYPGLTLDLEVKKPRYEIGEPIEVTLRFINFGSRMMRVEHHTYDRSGRMEWFGFSVTNRSGIAARDPILDSLGMFGGGLFNEELLPPGGRFEQTLTLNEWFSFEISGAYEITAEPAIVQIAADQGQTQWLPVAVKSKPLTIEIVPFDKNTRTALIARLERQLSQDQDTNRRDAMRRLRFLMDERGIPLQVKGLLDPVLRSESEFGLSSYVGPAAARVKGEVLKLIESDKTALVDGQRLWSYAQLLSLTELHARRKGLNPTVLNPDFIQRVWRWRHRLSDLYFERLEKMPLAEARERLRVAFENGEIVPVAARHWEFIATNASAIDSRGFGFAAQVIASNFEEWRMRSDLKAIASNEKLPPPVRAAATSALAKVSSTTFLFKELRRKLTDDLGMLGESLMGVLLGIPLVIVVMVLMFVVRRRRRAT
jgi:hypothetical protein